MKKLLATVALLALIGPAQAQEPTKTDIRGFKLDMTLDEIVAPIRAITRHECEEEQEKIIYPCFRRYGTTLTILFDQDTDLAVRFTEHLTVNKVSDVSYHFKTPKTSREVSASVAQQYGLPFDNPDRAGPNRDIPPIGARAPGDFPHQWWLVDRTHQIALVGGPGNHHLELHNLDLPKQDQKALQDSVTNLPQPKF